MKFFLHGIPLRLTVQLQLGTILHDITQLLSYQSVFLPQNPRMLSTLNWKEYTDYRGSN